MIDLPGIAIPQLPVGDADWVSDLEFFEWPIVSYFRNDRGSHYLRYWVDSERDVNRWMFARVSENHIFRLASRVESLDNVIPSHCQDGYVFFYDTRKNKRQAVTLAEVAEIPIEYTPESGAYLRPARDPKDKSFPLFIEGDLSIEELSEIPRKFMQAYYALFLLNANTAQQQKFLSHPWHGDGYSSMHFYRELATLMAPDAPFGIEKVQYASPGFIEFSVHRPTADFVSSCITLASDKKSDASRAFTALGSYIRQHELNDLAQDDAAWKSHNKELLLLTKRLLSAMDVATPGILISSAPRPFEAAQVARSIFRRLTLLARHQKSGAITLPRP